MDDEMRIFFLPFLFISVVIGYEIFAYFLYQYYKGKDEKLDLNKVLLGIGIIFGLLLTGFFIRTVNLYYIRDINLETFGFLTRLTFLITYSSLMIFFIIISNESFSEIINLKLTKVLVFLLIIPISTVFFLQVESPLFMIISLITLVSSYSYILYFQTKLIKLATGDIKKRLRFILIGFLLSMIQHFIGGYLTSYVLFEQYSNILQAIAIPTLLAGLLIVFLGVYRFPAFLEFGWKENLSNIFIIDRRNNNLLYKFDFSAMRDEEHDSMKESSNLKERELFFSKGVIGIDDIFHGVTKSNERGIEKIRRGELIILFKHGDDPTDFISYSLVVKKDMKSFEYFLKSIKNQFQAVYKNMLIDLSDLKGNEKKIFSGFDKILISLTE